MVLRFGDGVVMRVRSGDVRHVMWWFMQVIPLGAVFWFLNFRKFH